MASVSRALARRSALAFVAIAAALLISGLCAPASARAAGVLLEIPASGDVSYDSTRGILYVTSIDASGSAVLRYDVTSDRFLAPFPVPGRPKGIDLSPDGSLLAVADSTYDASSIWLHVLDTATGDVRSVTVPRSGDAKGTNMVAFGADGRVRFTLGDSHQFWLWTDFLEFDPATGALRTVATHIGIGSAVSASGDRQTIVLGEGGANEGGPWGILRVADGTWTEYHSPNGTGASNRMAAANHDGTLQAIWVYSDTHVYGPGPTLLREIYLRSPRFSPSADVLYGFPDSQSVLSAVRTSDFSEAGRWELGSTLWSAAFAETRLAISSDDRLAFATVDGGVRMIPLGLSLQGSVFSTYRGVLVKGAVVEFWRSGTSGWSLESTRTTRGAGTWAYPTEDLTPLRVRVVDPGGIHPPVWIGGTSLDTASDLVAGTGAAAVHDVTLTAQAPGSLVGSVVSSLDGSPVTGVYVQLFDSTGRVLLEQKMVAPDGTYRFDGLGPMSYRLGFIDPSASHESIYATYSRAPAASYATITQTGDTLQPVATLSFIPFKVGVAIAFPNSQVELPTTVELWRESPIGGFVLDSSSAGGGIVRVQTNHPGPFRVRVQESSGFYGEAWYGGIDATSALPVYPNRSYWWEQSCAVQLPLAAPGSITGIVRSAHTGGAAPGVRVDLYPNKGSSSVADSTVTDADGRYRFSDLGPGARVLRLSDPSGAHYPMWAGGQPPGSDPSPASISVPGQVVSLDATMAWVPLGLAGSVRSEAFGLPVPGATIELWRRGAGGVYALETTLTADAAGAWSIVTSDDEPVRVLAKDGDGFHSPTWLGGGALADASDILPSRSSPLPQSDLPMTLTVPASITGSVHSSKGGGPIEGVDVLAFAEGVDEPVGAAVTDPDGAYTIDGLPRGSYLLYFEDWTGAHEPQESAPLSITAPAAATVDATLTYVPPSVSGTVYSSSGGVPVSNATVEVWRLTLSGWQLETSLTADADGWWVYAVDDLRPVRVRVVDPTGMHDPAWFWGATSLALATDVLPGYDWGSFAPTEMTLSRPATIRGTVRNALSSTLIAGAKVYLCSYLDGYTAFETSTAADGTYGFAGVPPSAYAIAFEGPDERYYGQWWDGVSTIDEATIVNVTGPSLQVVDALLEPVLTDEPDFLTTTFRDGPTAYVGETVTLRATLIDVVTGSGLPGKRMTLQSSLDGVGWTDSVTSVHDRTGGVYEADIALTDTVRRYYRFAVASTDFSTAALSGVVQMAPQPFAISLPSLAIHGGLWSGSTSTALAHGYPIPVRASVAGVDAGVLDKLRGCWILQRSTDGVTWVDDSSATFSYGQMEVAAWVAAKPGLVRFALRPPRFSRQFVTPTAQFLLTTRITISSSAASARYPKPFVLQGLLTPGNLLDPCVVEVKKPGSARWSYSSARLAYAVTGASAKWWYRYTPRLRGTYTFRARFAGDTTRASWMSGIVTVQVR